MIGALDTLFTGMLADSFILRYRFRARITAAVIQMHAAAAIAYLSGFDAHIHQALAKLAILAAILHAFIETIGFDNVLFPG